MKLLITFSIIIAFVSCKKEHAKYRYTPKFHIGDLVQYEKSIEHDFGKNGTHLYDDAQPFLIDSFYWNETWRDHWYYIHSQSTGEYQGSIDELQLQRWNGVLQK